MPAVVLRGPANSAPEEILGPFATIDEAEEWAELHPREGGYCVAEHLTSPREGASELLLGLEGSALMAFVPVTDIDAARNFYASTLRLSVLDESPLALVVDANGTMLRITPVPELRRRPFTIAGWQVDDIEATIDLLSSRGVVFTHYDGMGQRDNGVWESPSRDLVAWFTDPDGNTLSLTEFVDHSASAVTRNLRSHSGSGS
jgi:catechol 2,3-dioxygenase-like lactoylglutathione lyase family enzyme